MNEKFLQVQVLYSFLELEPYILLGLLVFCSWLFYKFFLQDVSEERHRNLKNHHRVLFRHFLLLSIFFGAYLLSIESAKELPMMDRLTPYFAIFAFLWGMIVFVKACRLWVLQYLFLQSMQEGVPLLVVNVFTLMVSLGLGFWAASKLFNLQIGPLLATSAALSVILGLALQDTLGNLFAGISLQLDKSIEIGDWVEVVSGIQKAVGQVKEISWRSVLLVGLSDEVITLPNRFLAQAQISNFSPPDQPICRTQLFRIKYGTDVNLVKDLLEQSIIGVPEVRELPAPYAYVFESNESWVSVKLLYYMDSYGAQWRVGDRVLRHGLAILANNKIQLASNEMLIHKSESNK